MTNKINTMEEVVKQFKDVMASRHGASDFQSAWTETLGSVNFLVSEYRTALEACKAAYLRCPNRQASLADYIEHVSKSQGAVGHYKR